MGLEEGEDEGGGFSNRPGERKLRILMTIAQPVAGDELAKISYREQQSELRRRLGRVVQLRNGHLLDTMERGVLYPVLSIDWSPSKEAILACTRTKEDDFGPDLRVMQGVYEEAKRIEPHSSRVDSDQPRSFIILGFRSLDSSVSSVLENTWRDWTGARNIYLNLQSEFDLVKIVFFHRLLPRTQLDMFMYTVVVELANVNADNLIRLLDFVQRTRVERMNGYISLYRDLGLIDTDSNYFSGEERSESKMSNACSKGSGSRDSLLGLEASDEGYRTMPRPTSDWQQDIRILSNKQTRKESSESGISFSSTQRKQSNESTASDWRKHSAGSDWRKLSGGSDWRKESARRDWRKHSTGSSDSDWSRFEHDRRTAGLLLCVDTDERLNLPDPIKAQPCPPLGVQGRGQGHSQGLVQGSQPCPPLGVLDRVQGPSKGQGQGQAHVLGQSGQVPNQKVQTNTDSPPAGFTSQVKQLREALAFLPPVNKPSLPFGFNNTNNNNNNNNRALPTKSPSYNSTLSSLASTSTLPAKGSSSSYSLSSKTTANNYPLSSNTAAKKYPLSSQTLPNQSSSQTTANSPRVSSNSFSMSSKTTANSPRVSSNSFSISSKTTANYALPSKNLPNPMSFQNLPNRFPVSSMTATANNVDLSSQTPANNYIISSQIPAHNFPLSSKAASGPDIASTIRSSLIIKTKQ